MKNVTKESPPKKPQTNQTATTTTTTNSKPKTYPVPRLPQVSFPSLEGWGGLALMVSVSTSRAGPPQPERQLSLLDTFRFLRDTLPYRKIEARWDGRTWNPKPKLEFFHSHPDVGPPS